MRRMDKDLCDLNESRAEGHIDDEKKLWLGNLDADLTKVALMAWLRTQNVKLMYQPRDFVRGRCKSGWIHDFLYRVPPPTPPPTHPRASNTYSVSTGKCTHSVSLSLDAQASP